jgi:Ca-activated chloride channel family protein
MIAFDDNYILLLLLVVAVLICLYFFTRYRRFKTISRWGDVKMFDGLFIGYSGYRNSLKLVLLLFALTFLVIALASPYLIETHEQVVEPDQTSIVFVIDVSESMLARDILPDRLQQAQSAVVNIIKQLNGEQVGVVLFAGKANTYIPLSSDYRYVSAAVNNITTGLIQTKGTAINNALKISPLLFSRQNKNASVMCVLSDGEDHEKGFEKLADSIRNSGINIFAMGFGTVQGANIFESEGDGTQTIKKGKDGVPVVTRLHPENLVRLTGSKAKRYWPFTNKETITDGFITQLKTIEANSRIKITSKNRVYKVFALLAFILLVVDVLVPASGKQ